MNLGDRIRIRRNELNLSQTELAEKMGYSDRSTIAKIESGKNDLNQSKIQQMAECLQTTPEYLMGWTDDPYDYNADRNKLYSQIPTAQLEALKESCENDMRQVWQRWQQMRQQDYFEGAHTSDIPQMGQTYLRLAKGAQELGLDDEDVDMILAMYQKHKQKNQ